VGGGGGSQKIARCLVTLREVGKGTGEIEERGPTAETRAQEIADNVRGDLKGEGEAARESNKDQTV